MKGTVMSELRIQSLPLAEIHKRIKAAEVETETLRVAALRQAVPEIVVGVDFETDLDQRLLAGAADVLRAAHTCLRHAESHLRHVLATNDPEVLP